MIAAAAASGAGGAGRQLQGPVRAGRTRTAAARPRFQDADAMWNRGVAVTTDKARALTLSRRAGGLSGTRKQADVNVQQHWQAELGGGPRTDECQHF